MFLGCPKPLLPLPNSNETAAGRREVENCATTASGFPSPLKSATATEIEIPGPATATFQGGLNRRKLSSEKPLKFLRVCI